MDLNTITKKMKLEAKKLEGAPKKLKRQLDVQVGKVRKQLDAAPAKLKLVQGRAKKQLDGAPAKLKKQFGAEVKKVESASGRLKKQLEALQKRAVEAFGIVSTSQLKSLRTEMSRLTKRVDALTRQEAASKQTAA